MTVVYMRTAQVRVVQVEPKQHETDWTTIRKYPSGSDWWPEARDHADELERKLESRLSKLK
jgi:hypothetical protein